MTRAVRRAALALGALLLIGGLGWWGTIAADGVELPAVTPAADDDDSGPPVPADEKQARVLARLRVDRAARALGDGDLASARRLAHEALAIDADMTDALRLLAVIEKRAGNDGEACRLMRDYVGRAATPEPARARLLASACGDVAR